MELPDDVIKIINEYAMPATRSDWRTLHIMTYDKYLREFYIAYKKRQRNMLQNNIFSEYNYGRIIYHT